MREDALALPPQRRWVPWTAFALLCAIAATRWMLSAAQPATASSVATLAAGCGLAALLCFAGNIIFSARRKPVSALVSEAPRNSTLRDALAGALLFAGPVLALIFAVPGTDSSLIIALALAPVAAGVTLTALGDGSGSLAGRVWPGLAAVGGLLLVLPQPSLADPRIDLVLALAPVLTGIGAALFGAPQSRGPAEYPRLLTRGASALSGAALAFSAALIVQLAMHAPRPAFSPLAATIDAAIALLSILAIGRLGTMRWSAQFAIVPLLVLAEGFIIMRARPDVRGLAGLGLLLLAGVVLLLPQSDEDDEEDALSLRE